MGAIGQYSCAMSTIHVQWLQLNVRVEIRKIMLKYFRGYHRPMKINQHEYLPHE